MTISNRLLKIKGSRSVLQWERQTGIARGNLDRGIRDGKLSDENIRKLIRTENIRADWLLEGKGTPYQIAVFNDDLVLSELLCAHHTDEARNWTLTVICRQSDGLPCAITLTMEVESQAVKDDKKSDIDKYTVLEILTGPIGPYSREAIKRDGWGKRQQVTLDDAVVESLCKGGIGTYALTLDPGYLKAAVPLDDKTLADVAEESAGYTIPLTPPEQRLLTTYRALPNDDRARLLAIADTLKACAS